MNIISRFWKLPCMGYTPGGIVRGVSCECFAFDNDEQPNEFTAYIHMFPFGNYKGKGTTISSAMKEAMRKKEAGEMEVPKC